MTSTTMGDGFSLVEVIIALLILSVAILGMGASTGHVMAQIQASQLRTERMEAVRRASESLRASAATRAGWADLSNECATDPYVSTTNYDVACDVTTTGMISHIMLITEGPAFVSGRFQQSVTDSTFSIRIANPVN